MSQKEYICRYCGVKVGKYSTICGECSKKLKLVRELKQLLDDIKRREQTNKCDYCIDEVCVNADCPLCADFCPLVYTPGICKFEKGVTTNAR